MTRRAQNAPAAPDAREPDERPSKSQRKREMTALQDLGEELLALPVPKLRALPIPPELVEAVELAQRIHSREGLRRQRQYIGRLMRDVDVGPLRLALDVDGAGHRLEVARMHAAERWRERLLGEPGALAAFRARHGDPGAEFERCVADAGAELARGLPGRRYRELYRSLRACLSADDAASKPSPEPAP